MRRATPPTTAARLNAKLQQTPAHFALRNQRNRKGTTTGSDEDRVVRVVGNGNPRESTLTVVTASAPQAMTNATSDTTHDRRSPQRKAPTDARPFCVAQSA